MADQYTPFSAPMAQVWCKGKLVGWATDLNGNERRTNVPVNPLGTVYTQQLCTTLVQVTFSVGKVFIKEESLSDMGVFIQGSSDQIVVDPPLDFIVLDKLPGNKIGADAKPVLEVRGARASGRAYSLQRGGIMTEGASYDACELHIYSN